VATTAGEDSSVERTETATEAPIAAPPVSPKAMTPGQRLAARKASKAKRKAELKGTADTPVEEIAGEVEKAAAEFTDFWGENQKRILIGIGAFLVVSIGVLLWSRQADSSAAAEADALYAAVELTEAEVDADNASEGSKTEDPVFASAADRAKAAVESFAALQRKYGGSEAAAWGLLGEGAAQLDLGASDKAKEAFENALKQVGDRPALAARALEGLALASEQAGNSEAALGKLDELGKLADGQYRDLAEYHTARLKLAKGERDAAKDLLKGVYDRLSAPEPGTPAYPYLKGQVELSLMELDSSLVDKASMGAGGGFGGPGGMTQEQLQQLLQQLQQKQQGSP